MSVRTPNARSGTLRPKIDMPPPPERPCTGAGWRIDLTGRYTFRPPGATFFNRRLHGDRLLPQKTWTFGVAGCS
jgi:hypothetical protein